MFILPWKTDAPIYHMPIATVGMIVLNILVFVLLGPGGSSGVEDESVPAYQDEEGVITVLDYNEGDFRIIDEEDPDYEILYDEDGNLVVIRRNGKVDELSGFDLTNVSHWELSYGKGLHPMQWVTSNFIHGSIFHLLGNLIFMWTFSLVVEGKIGWQKYLLVYMGIGVSECAFEQIVTLGFSGGSSFGASSIIFGLVAVCLVWAPKNEMSCLLFFMYIYFFNISIVNLALIFISFEVLYVVLGGFALGSSMLHLFGAAIGFVVGAVMVKKDWVNCEHWDLFSVRAGRHTMTRAQREQEIYDSEEHQERIRQKKEEAAEQLKQLLGQGNASVALEFYRKTVQMLGTWELPEDLLLGLIAGLDKQKAYAEAMPLMKEYLRRFPEKGTKIRLKIAQILIRHERQPGIALGMLEKMDAQAMPEPLQKAWQTLQKEAVAMKNENEDELGLMGDEDDF